MNKVGLKLFAMGPFPNFAPDYGRLYSRGCLTAWPGDSVTLFTIRDDSSCSMNSIRPIDPIHIALFSCCLVPHFFATTSCKASIFAPQTHLIRPPGFFTTIGQHLSEVSPVHAGPAISYTLPSCIDVTNAFCARGRRTCW